jgi:predicted nucleic acid-binding protein
MNDDRVFLDSNVCLYLLGASSPKKQIAEKTLALPKTVISSQVIGENINVGLKKLRLSPEKIIAHIDFLLLNCELVGITVAFQKKAVELHTRYQISFYDGLIAAAALGSNCTTLYSEDLQHNQLIDNKLTIVNPFIQGRIV